ncbi:hypothetical protein, unlikely [Trypanosoma brucei gambiense DAL972]|uniref:Uncharacterized protein n=1 Tax=Trypanosoma brucei gambiense (strain MHOM/CI/86/DAL972) TaxID=679716 RepID=D0A5L7_TRYB9|nr:hypothetical protein, unlikely [Trypanosoma brucei gambiense DAL972]CBH16968.1 hypothetical protein, unlikely [Trypanosoma brucei gambiense DAL972]|eukprot:XP_011779232.1 hypothetical protein, unlikely [Trypanosoma brucei gambiense DAL972]
MKTTHISVITRIHTHPHVGVCVCENELAYALSPEVNERSNVHASWYKKKTYINRKSGCNPTTGELSPPQIDHYTVSLPLFSITKTALWEAIGPQNKREVSQKKKEEGRGKGEETSGGRTNETDQMAIIEGNFWLRKAKEKEHFLERKKTLY